MSSSDDASPTQQQQHHLLGLLRPMSSALDDIEAERPLDALTTLLSAWRTTLVPEVGDVIDMLGRRITEQLPPIGPTNAAWLAVAKRARIVDVTSLAARLEKGNLQTRADRLAVLMQQPLCDPRLTKPLIAIVTDFASLANNLATFPIWGRIFEALASQKDVRARAPLLALRTKLPDPNGKTTRFDRMFAGGVARVLESLPTPERAATRDLSQVEGEAIEALRIAISAATPASWDLTATTTHATAAHDTAAAMENQLLEAIYADPEDDAPRHVYADWLLERNDPRGSFIALQLKRDSPYGMFVGREGEEIRLLGQFMRVWLGPALPWIVVGTARFRRGFLSSAVLRFPNEVEKHAALGALPIWRTLSEVSGTFMPLLIPENRSLRKLSLSIPMFRELMARDAPTNLKELHLKGMRADEEPLPSACQSLPALKHVTIESQSELTESQLRWFSEHPLFLQLEQLHLIHTYNSQKATGIDEWMRVFAATPTLQEMQLGRLDDWYPTFTLRRLQTMQTNLLLELKLVKGTNESMLMTQLESMPSSPQQKWTLTVIPSIDAQKTHSALHKRIIQAFPSFIHNPLADPR